MAARLRFPRHIAAVLAAAVLCIFQWAPSDAAPATAGAPATVPPAPDHFNHGRFQNVAVYPAQGTPRAVVLLLAGGGSSAAAPLAQALARHGAMVALIDVSRFDESLEADGGDCVFPDGDLENLSHFIQAYYRLPVYRAPFLVGIGAGANLAYAVLAQAPAHTFAGAMTIGFCDTAALHKPLCKGEALQSERAPDGQLRYVAAPRLEDPWVALQGEGDGRCAPSVIRDFVAHMQGAALVPLTAVREQEESRWLPAVLAAFDTLAGRAAAAPAPPVALGKLPVIEVPARAGAPPSDLLAIILSGDGGWAGLDREVAEALSAHGIPVGGLDSLRYFWSARTPQGLAADLDRMIRYYLDHFAKQRVLLIGYSQGADVLPFALNRLPAATRARIALAVLMSMSEHAVFEFHMSNWIRNDNSGPATRPEVERVSGVPVLCIYGEGDQDTLCPTLDPAKVQIVKLPGGHHFNGDYAGLARQILAAAAR